MRLQHLWRKSFLKKKENKTSNMNTIIHLPYQLQRCLPYLKLLDIYIKFINHWPVGCCFEMKSCFPIHQRHRLGTFHNRRGPLPRGVERSKWRRGTGKAHRHLPATGYTPL